MAVSLCIFLIIGISFMMITHSESQGITHEEMQNTGKLMKQSCLPKFKTVSEEVANKIKLGEFPEDRDVKCYVNCVMELMGSMKKGKFNTEASLKQIDLLLPEDLKDTYRNGVHNCKEEAKGIKDHCEASYIVLKCFFKNAENFIFP